MSLDNKLILNYYSVLDTQDDEGLATLLRSTRDDTKDQYLGAALGLAASVCNVVAVEYLIAKPLSCNIAANGQYGLGRALFFGSETGTLEIVKKIFQHQNAKDIDRDGKYSLMHARVTALSNKHDDIVEIISERLNLV